MLNVDEPSARGKQTKAEPNRMEAVIHKRALLRGIARCNAVADRQSSMHMLSNVLLVATQEDMRFQATDLYQAVQAKSPCKVKTPGAVAVSAKTVHDIVKNLPEGDVKLTVNKSHHLVMQVGKVRFKVPGMPADDFPPLPGVTAQTRFEMIPCKAIAQLAALTHFSICNDDSRPHLAGMQVELEGGILRMVSTDGHRMSLAECAQESEEGFAILVPAKGVAELRKIVDDMRAEKNRPVQEGTITSTDEPVLMVGVHLGSVFFRGPDVELSVKLADSHFPPYSKVIPSKRPERRLVVSRELLLGAVRRVSLVSSPLSSGVRLQLAAGSLSVAGESDGGEGSEEIDIDYPGSSITIGCNARYLIDVLAAMSDDDVAIELNSELEPVVLRPATEGEIDHVCVVMPMRV